MTKAAFISLGLAALVLIPAAVPAQDNPAAAAVNEAVMRQANTIVLRQKLSDAKAVAQRGDMVNAAKLYQEAVTLAQQIGSGIDPETAAGRGRPGRHAAGAGARRAEPTAICVRPHVAGATGLECGSEKRRGHRLQAAKRSDAGAS